MLTPYQQRIAWNIYGDWKLENLLFISNNPKSNPKVKKAVRFVLSIRNK